MEKDVPGGASFFLPRMDGMHTDVSHRVTEITEEINYTVN